MRAILAFLILAGLGGTIVLLPDSGPRLFSLSKAHGPSTLDAVGGLLTVAGGAILLASIWSGRHRLADVRPSRIVGAAFAAGLGAGLVVASVAGDWPHWWVLGVAVLVLVQLAAAWRAARGREVPPSTPAQGPR